MSMVKIRALVVRHWLGHWSD